jgi:putative oxidoreductase
MNSTISGNPVVPLVGRILIAALFLVAGVGKIMGFAGTAGYMAKLGFPVPEVMTAMAIVVEAGGAILLIVGWKTRWVAWALAIFTVIATLAAHRFWEIPDAAQMMNQRIHFLKNLAIIGGLLFVATFGPGSISVDKR